jgi:ribosomal protein S18 acetylase RimI-like enzyme
MTYTKQMPTSFYKKLDSISLAVIDLVDYPDKGLIITRINVPRKHRGKGIARELMKECLEEADNTGTNLWLEIQPSDGMSFDELKAWYHRLGFKGSSTGVLWRKAQKK